MTFEALALFMEKQYKFLTQITLIPGDNIINFRHHCINALVRNLVIFSIKLKKSAVMCIIEKLNVFYQR